MATSTRIDLDHKAPDLGGARPDLRARYQTVRAFSHYLCEPLVTEDYVIQSMPDVSPTKWHLAHSTWFFETFVLKQALSHYTPFEPLHEFLFNSYYNSVGKQYSRPHRGLLSRPTVDQVYEYRSYVDEHMHRLLEEREDFASDARMREILTIGLHHEQQHQELMVTDLKHVLSVNPLHPVYRPAAPRVREDTPALAWQRVEEGLYWLGHEGESFSYDNEGPRHQVFLQPFELASRLVTNEEFMAFMEDGGYETPTLWLSKGWAWVQEEQRRHPFYWSREEDRWYQHTLHGHVPIDPQEPVSHVSYYEADAYARWASARLPREGEWEVAAKDAPIEGNFVESDYFHPVPAVNRGGLQQLYGDVWEWTQSPYTPYPGYAPAEGALGEYNGKFMCDQHVLRGGSCATSITHIRPTYRNFFPAEAQWQFTGIRLARYC